MSKRDNVVHVSIGHSDIQLKNVQIKFNSKLVIADGQCYCCLLCVLVLTFICNVTNAIYFFHCTESALNGCWLLVTGAIIINALHKLK